MALGKIPWAVGCPLNLYPVQSGICDPVLSWYEVQYGYTSYTVSWGINLCPRRGLWPEGLCIWWVFSTNPRLILVHRLGKELRAQEIVVTFSISFRKTRHNLLEGLVLCNSPGKYKSRTSSPDPFNPTFRGTFFCCCHINLKVFFTMLSISLGYSLTYPVLWLQQNSLLSSAVCPNRGSKEDIHIRSLCPIQGTNIWKLTLSTFLP